MISRRSFIKSAALATVTVGAGYGLGSFFTKKNINSISFYGFLPSDSRIIEKVFTAYSGYLDKSINSVSVIGAGAHSEAIKNAVRSSITGSIFTSRHLTVNLSKINGSFTSDLMISNNNYILTPEMNFNSMLKEIRNQLKDTKAEYMFSAEVHDNNQLTDQSTSKGILVVENEKGIVDQIKLNRKQSDIVIHGNCGNTVISVGDNSAFVKSASCKNKLCQHSGIITPSNSSIACAPNKIILRLV